MLYDFLIKCIHVSKELFTPHKKIETLCKRRGTFLVRFSKKGKSFGSPCASEKRDRKKKC